MSTVHAAIIGGGQSRRMGGRPKHLLEVEGRRIVDRQIGVLHAVFSRVFVVSSDAVAWRGVGLEVVADRMAGAGPLGGIDAALAALPDDAGAVVCVACDMPFLDERILVLLRDAAPKAAAVVPRVGGRLEPLCARYGRACAPALALWLQRGERAAHRFCAHIGATVVEEDQLRATGADLRFSYNVNTPADLGGDGP